MPGILGVINRNGQVPGRLLREMMDGITHHYWYKTSSYIDENFAFGSVNLGIVNSEQPVFSRDKTLCAIMDGEVLDYDDLKKDLILKGYEFTLNNDVEFLLFLYQEYGKDFVKKLNGLFTIVIWDKKNQRLIIANDIHGFRPLYYANYKNKFIFCSEVKGILRDSDFDKEIDEAAIADFFSFEYIMGDKTFFKHIKVLPPASILTFEDGEISLDQYWDFEYKEDYKSYKLDDYLEEFAFLLNQAVNRCMKGGYVVGVPLSGGLDSRTIVGMIDEKHLPVHTFTFGLPECNDIRFARGVSETVGTIHHEVPIKYEYLEQYIKKGIFLTDGMSDCIHFQILNIVDEMGDSIQVALSGILGSVIWGHAGSISDIAEGLGSFNVLSKIEARLLSGVSFDSRLKSNKINISTEILFKKDDVVGESTRKIIFSQNFYDKTKNLSFESYLNYLGQSNAMILRNRHDYINLRQRQRRFINNGDLNIRSKTEVRAPFCDRDLIDFYLRVPPDLRRGQVLYLEAFKRKLPELAKIPRQITELPIDCSKSEFALKLAEVAIKKGIRKLSYGKIKFLDKRNLTDYDNWFRTYLRNFIRDTLLDNKFKSREYFNHDFIKSLLELHISGKADYAMLIGCLLTFELWHRMFVD